MKQFIYRINGQEYIVAVNRKDESNAEVAVNGTNYNVELVNDQEEVTLVARPAAAKPAATPSSAPKATAPAKGGAAGSKAIKSPLPGIVVAINVAVGDTVKKGQTVAILEAMKMENNIQAPADGTVASIDLNVGDSVLEGVSILSLQ
ncbi:MAG: biotin/lipoyl attachment protein [Bacteroidetes bacterium]|nr:biotin/lipoyl attachment protein [Bacteroidota bacterium]